MTPSPRRRTSSPSPADGPRVARAAATSSTNRRDALDRGRPPVEPLERVEQVAGAELRPEQRERVGPRDGVEAEVVAEREHRAALAGLRARTRPRARGALGRAPRTCPGSPRSPSRRPCALLLAHLVPHFALATPRASGCAASISALRRRRCGWEMWAAAAERGAAPLPAALLDAGDGDRQLRAGLDEHAHVEDPVLLRADELLAVVEQHPRVGRVRTTSSGTEPASDAR